MNQWFFFCVILTSSTSFKIIQLFTADGSGSLSHMVLSNDSLFIGATNTLYQFDLNLDLEIKIITGPYNDSRKCGINLEMCSALSELLLMDNYNKILLLHSDMLVICGSLFQGKCEIRNVKNISEVIYIGNTAVASNEVDVNTIAFIAQDRNSEPMLYVATEFTRFDKTKNSLEFNHRRSHPLVSTRLLDFSLRGKISYETENKYMKPGLISYVNGFASGNYSYIVCNERNPDDTNHYSKIVHMCSRDGLLKTFLEIPLTCKSNSKTFNILKTAKIFRPAIILLKSLQEQFPDMTSEDDVIIGLFSHNVDNSSAICLFSMPEVTKIVLTNIKTCLNGSTEYAARLKYKNGLTCTKIQQLRSIKDFLSLFTDDELLCSGSLNLIIDGKTPVVSNPVIQFPAKEDNPESLAVTFTGEHTVAFLGTSNGHINKVVLKTSSKAELYDSAIVVDEGHAINQDMAFDNSQMFLYAMSDRKVAKIPVQNCSLYAMCKDCLSSNDPYCGWCVLDHRCSLKSDCYNPTHIRWVNGTKQENRCVEILNVSPPMLHVSENITLNLTIKDLPRDDNTSYNCVFSFPNGDQIISQAVQWRFGTECMNPNVENLRISFNSSLGYINVSLGILSDETDQVIVSSPYLFYNCSSFTSCSTCVDNIFWCDWCITENKCQFNTDQCSGEKVSSQKASTIGQRKTFCPMVDASQTGPLMIEHNQIKTIVIQGKNFPEPDKYKGQIQLPSRILYVNGRRISSTQLIFMIGKASITLKVQVKVMDKTNGDMDVTCYLG
ncbi:plexin-B-like [Saccostrea cucullata]|uniref:plexin-B-like n=1 Tax=Saccostrea cuccullata TaxID=36930 RepID=UPI002ED5EFF3